MTRPRGLLAPMVALLAVSLLTAMALSGHLRESKQFVKFTPAGVMAEAPAEIDRVELRASSRRWILVRGSSGWRVGPDGPPVSASLAAHLDSSIKFMHVSAPIRVMEHTEWGPVGLREFGLDPPDYIATLYHHDSPVLGARFGMPNPQKVLQYMKVDGRDEVYLMARFIGEEWEKTLREMAGG